MAEPQIMHPDGRVELTEHAPPPDAALVNEDLAPTPIAARTWSTYNYAALWISMAHCIPTYMLASGWDITRRTIGSKKSSGSLS